MKTLLIAVLAFVGACSAQAQTYPTQPITFVVPFPPGGSASVTLVFSILDLEAGYDWVRELSVI